MRVYSADLHIHTGLSPCAASEMTPPAIVRAALERGLSMIAICDHNTAGNAAATQRAAGDALAVLAGIEITTAEEVHIVGIFPDAEKASEAAAAIRDTLPTARPDDTRRFGEQEVMNENGENVGIESRLLAAASRFSLQCTIDLIKRIGGLAIAAHVNRPSFSVTSQLGMFPRDVGFDAIELFIPAGATVPFGAYAGYGLPLLTSSDSHYLANVGLAQTKLEMEHPCFEEFKLAIRGERGRRVVGA